MLEEKTILMIEDEPDFLRIYSDLLKSKGYRVLTASEGNAGWDLLVKERPDLVLLDLVLPGLHGLDILERAKHQADTSKIPIIIFSVVGDGENIQKALAMGASDYAVKGYYKPADLIDKIESLLLSPEGKQTVKSYELALKENTLDYPRLVQEMKLSGGLICPVCQTPLVLKMMADYTHQNEHWFNSHLYCTKCQKIY